MKNRTLKTVIIGAMMLVLWMIASEYIGFETTVLVALATIYGYQQ